jgi:putative transposase
VTLKHRIDEIYTRYPFFVSRRITVHLRRDGLCVNRKAVQHHMREMGIAGICPGPNLSRRTHGEQVYPYLLRSVTCCYPNHVWGIDVTYIRLQRSWMYLVAVLAWFSRYVVSWERDDTLQFPFVLHAVKRALTPATPVIWNSDQGSHFTSPQYRELLLAAGVQISMDGKGRALDNVFVERLWRSVKSVKYENVYPNDYTNPREARAGLTQYLTFYHHERPHQALDYRTPAEVYEVRRQAGGNSMIGRRPYDGEADLPAVLDLLVRCQAAGSVDMEVYSTRLRIALRDPAFDVAHLTLLVEDEVGTLSGYAALWRGTVLLVLVHPRHREALEPELVAWAMQAATACASAQVWIPCRADDALGCSIYEQGGFELADEELRLSRALEEPIAQPALPPGFSIGPLAGLHEVPAWNELYREAFGPAHMTLLSQHQTVMGDSDYDPALDLVARDADGHLAAICYCAIPSVEAAHTAVKEGRTEPIAVREQYRGQGLGRAIVLSGLHLLREHGMARAMLTTEVGNHHALRLYAALGYRLHSTAHWYLRAVR